MNYVELIEKSDACCTKAIEMLKKGELDLALFYKNASIGYKEKALNLTIGD